MRLKNINFLLKLQKMKNLKKILSYCKWTEFIVEKERRKYYDERNKN